MHITSKYCCDFGKFANTKQNRNIKAIALLLVAEMYMCTRKERSQGHTISKYSQAIWNWTTTLPNPRIKVWPCSQHNNHDGTNQKGVNFERTAFGVSRDRICANTATNGRGTGRHAPRDRWRWCARALCWPMRAKVFCRRTINAKNEDPPEIFPCC